MIQLAVAGLSLTPQGIVSAQPRNVTITSVPSPKVKAEGKGVYKTPLQFTVAGANAVGYQPGTVQGNGTIPATAVKVKVEGVAPMRMNDEGVAAMQGTTLAGTLQSFNETWRITAPNQSKVRGK